MHQVSQILSELDDSCHDVLLIGDGADSYHFEIEEYRWSQDGVETVGSNLVGEKQTLVASEAALIEGRRETWRKSIQRRHFEVVKYFR